MRKVVVLTAAALTAAGLGGPAFAACGSNLADQCSGTTTVAFTVLPDNGTISIVAAPAAVGAGLGETAPTSSGTDAAKTVTVVLGATTVLDGRTASPGWSVTATASAFTLTGTATTIAASKATFTVPNVPVAADSALLTGALTGASTSTISSRATSPASNGSVILASSSSSVNATTFTPQMRVDVTGATSGLYTGTVTQSVS